MSGNSTVDEMPIAPIFCAHCQSKRMQPFQIDVFDRAPDSRRGTHVWVRSWPHEDAIHNTGHGLDFSDNIDDNPSVSGSGMSIALLCMDCQHVTELRLAQQENEQATLRSREAGKASDFGLADGVNIDAILNRF